LATPVAFDSDQRFVPLKDELARPLTAQYGPIDRVTDAPATRGFKSRVRSDIASRPVPPRVDELTDERPRRHFLKVHFVLRRTRLTSATCVPSQQYGHETCA